MQLSTTLFFILTAICTVTAFRKQSYAVKGRLFCGNKPAAGVKVKLIDEDDGPDPDDTLDEGYTDSNGEFLLSGDTRELTPIDPRFKAYHNCDDEIQPGKRRWKFYLPNKYITWGRKPKSTLYIGDLNLETYLMEEDQDFIH